MVFKEYRMVASSLRLRLHLWKTDSVEWPGGWPGNRMDELLQLYFFHRYGEQDFGKDAE
jgi:hypothetical protein